MDESDADSVFVPETEEVGVVETVRLSEVVKDEVCEDVVLPVAVIDSVPDIDAVAVVETVVVDDCVADVEMDKLIDALIVSD